MLFRDYTAQANWDHSGGGCTMAEGITPRVWGQDELQEPMQHHLHHGNPIKKGAKNMKKITCLIALLILFYPVQKISGADKKADTSRCSALAGLAEKGFMVEKAEIVPAGPAPAADGSGVIDNNGEPLPEHCLVQGMLNPRTGANGRKFGLGFDLLIPTKWNS